MGLDANRMYEEKEIEADGIRTCICQQVFRGRYFGGDVVERTDERGEFLIGRMKELCSVKR